VTADDLLLLLVSLGHAVQITDECRPQMWKRLLRRISFDGLRADHREPLPPDASPDTHSPVAGSRPVSRQRSSESSRETLASAMGR
jgi:hypothetical protein